MAARNNRTSTNKAPRADEEASCDAATGATEWGGAGATVAYDAETAERDAVSVGCLRGWKCAIAGGRERGPGGASFARMRAMYVHHGGTC